MILRTRDSVYEVRSHDQHYRRVSPASPGAWTAYDRISPVVPGQPVRFFVSLAERGRSLHYRVVSTSPLVEVLPAA